MTQHHNHHRKPTGRRFLRAVSFGTKPFSREASLPQLLGLWPADLRDYSAEGTAQIIALLRKAIRAERRRSNSGHWAYDINRHIALAEALKAETVRLEQFQHKCGPAVPQCLPFR